MDLTSKLVKPTAVLISDVHYSLSTLWLAEAAMRQAIIKANELKVPLIVAGDLHETKANLRGECVNAMIETFKLCNAPPYILIGNHDRLNEKAPEHALNFLKEHAVIIDYRTSKPLKGIGYFIPYAHDAQDLKDYLKTLPDGSQIIMHQGIQGSNSGEYFQDKSAIQHSDVSNFRVISGHYHARQDIKTGRPRKGSVGLYSYIGSPYTMTFGEANDPYKGFQILMNDGTLEFVSTNLRKHVIVEIDENKRIRTGHIGVNDLVWVKARGTKTWLSKISKESFKAHGVPIDFRLELIPTDDIPTPKIAAKTQAELLDTIIDKQSIDNKTHLKSLWKQLCE